LVSVFISVSISGRFLGHKHSQTQSNSVKHPSNLQSLSINIVHKITPFSHRVPSFRLCANIHDIKHINRFSIATNENDTDNANANENENAKGNAKSKKREMDENEWEIVHIANNSNM
jgi:hypothetical protein